MIISIINIIIFLLGVISAYSRNVNRYLFSIIFFSTSYFGIIPAYSNYFITNINNSDLALILLFFGLIFLPNQQNQSIRTEVYLKFKKMLNFFIFFLLLIILIDFLYNSNSISNIFNETRVYFFLLSIKLIERVDFKNTFQLVEFLILSIAIKSIVYNLQYVLGIEIFENSEFLASVGKFRGYNIFFSVAFIFILLKKQINFRHIFFLINLFLSTILLGSAGHMIVVFLVLAIYFLNSNYKIKFILTPFFLIALIFTVSSPLVHDFSDEVSQISTFQSDFEASNNLYEFYQGGSFQFRIAQLFERYYYLSDNNNLLFGAGFTPDSKLEKQIFLLGTPTDTYEFGIEQFNSADILYVNTLSRFGIIGLVIFLLVFVSMCQISLTNKFLAFSFIIFLIITSLNSDFLYRMQNLVFLFFIYFYLFNKSLFEDQNSLSLENE